MQQFKLHYTSFPTGEESRKKSSPVENMSCVLLCDQSMAGTLQGSLSYLFRGKTILHKLFYKTLLLGQIRTPRRENSHIEYRSMLRIVSFVIHFKALMSLDIFISYISEIMVIFNVKKKILLIFFLFGPNYLPKNTR